MAARLLGFSCALALVFAVPAAAEDGAYGGLDFARLTKPQAEFFWRRLKSLAVEAAVLGYCGEADDFERQAQQGIRTCVTQAALEQADGYFKTEMKAAAASLRARKAACKLKPAADRGWLGVQMGAAPNGALVTAAVAGSPAAAADLKSGDVIADVNGETVAGPKELSAKIRALKPGATVALGLIRDGAPRSVAVKLGATAIDASGQVALDMPELIASSRQDLASVATEVADLCRNCKSSIWALFCR